MKTKTVKRIISFIILILVPSFLCGLLSSCKRTDYTAEDIYGWWESERKTDHHYVLYIHEEYTEFFMFYDETEETADRYATTHWISGSFDIPEGEFASHTWVMYEDYDRTDTGGDWYWRNSNTPKENSYGIRFEFKEGKIYWEHLLGSGNFTIFTKSQREHPMCERVIEQRQRCYEASFTAKPLELGEVRYFPENNRSQDVPNAFFCIEITNPNPFRVYYPELIFYKDNIYCDDNMQIVYESPVSQFIEANSTVMYVGSVYEDLVDVSQVKCEARYNIYSVMFEGQKPVVEVGTSEVKKDESGRVCEVVVKTRASMGSGSFNGDGVRDRYFLNIVFYKDGKIIGCGNDVFDYSDIKTPDTISWFTPVTDYDYYEIYVS